MLSCIVSIRCAKRAKQYGAFSAEELLAEDQRKPVLYLRSFGDDPHGASFTADSLISRSTNEEQLAEVLSEFGPVIAIGQPDDVLPQLGAARDYPSDDRWKTRVKDYLRRAQLVVIRIGQTDGLRWEIKEAIRLAKPDQLVLLLPPDLELYRSFRQFVRGLIPRSLPKVSELSSREPSARHQRIGLWAVMTFDTQWSPSFQPLYSPIWRQGIEKPLIPRLRFAFRNVFENLGQPWTPPPLNFGAILAAILATAFGFFNAPSLLMGLWGWILGR